MTISMTDDQAYDALIALFKTGYLRREWEIHAHDTYEAIQTTHGRAPLQQLRSLMLLTANHHLASDGQIVGDPLWDPQRPTVGKRLLEQVDLITHCIDKTALGLK